VVFYDQRHGFSAEVRAQVDDLMYGFLAKRFASDDRAPQPQLKGATGP
jgi:hypothetical protein